MSTVLLAAAVPNFNTITSKSHLLPAGTVRSVVIVEVPAAVVVTVLYGCMFIAAIGNHLLYSYLMLTCSSVTVPDLAVVSIQTNELAGIVASLKVVTVSPVVTDVVVVPPVTTSFPTF